MRESDTRVAKLTRELETKNELLAEQRQSDSDVSSKTKIEEVGEEKNQSARERMMRYLELAQRKAKNMEQNVFNIALSRSSSAARGRDFAQDQNETSSSSVDSSESTEDIIDERRRPRKQDSSDDEEFNGSRRRGRSTERSTGRDRGTSASRARFCSSSRNFPNEAGHCFLTSKLGCG